MRNSTVALCAIVSLLTLSACGAAKDEPSKPTAGPLLQFETGGGFAPRVRSLTVQQDGSALLYGSDTESAEFTLSDDELQQLERALAATPASEIGSTGGSYCADCFTYSLEYGGEKYSGDDADVSTDGKEVIAAVSELVEAHLTTPAEGEVLVRYGATGGLSGTSSTFVVNADGSAVLKGSELQTKRFFVAPDQMQELRRTLAENPVDSLGPGTDPDCMDCPGVSLDYGDSHFDTNDPEHNDALDEVISALSTISAEHAVPRPGSVIE